MQSSMDGFKMRKNKTLFKNIVIYSALILLISNFITGIFADPNGEAMAYQEILKISGFKKNELSVSEVSLDRGLFGSAAQYKFNFKNDLKEATVRIDLQRTFNLMPWSTVELRQFQK